MIIFLNNLWYFLTRNKFYAVYDRINRKFICYGDFQKAIMKSLPNRSDVFVFTYSDKIGWFSFSRLCNEEIENLTKF